MSVLISTTWSPSSNFYSDWLATVAVISVLACFVVSLRLVRESDFGQWLVVLGAPIFFFVVLFSESGMFLLKDGREFGFPLWARAYPNAADFLGTYVVLGAGYLIAREATRMPLRAVRIIGWIEVVGFASLGAFELFLLIRRVFIG